MKIPIIIIGIGLIAAVISCLFAGIVKEPVIVEHDFNYSVTYRLNGEVKTVEGVYRCRFDNTDNRVSPSDRYYVGEFLEYGLAVHAYSYTIAQKDGFDLSIATNFNDCYLMGDTKNEYYTDSLEDPFFIVYDRDGVPYGDSERLEIFDAEIISWKYPEPIDNSFVFVGFSMLYEGSMLVMLLIGIIVVVACLYLVKKDESVSYGKLDKIGIVLNFIIAFVAFPFLTLASWLIQAYPSGSDWIYGGYLCVPATIAFSLAASISFRRKGFAKTGFFIQLLGVAMFFVFAAIEWIL